MRGHGGGALGRVDQDLVGHGSLPDLVEGLNHHGVFGEHLQIGDLQLVLVRLVAWRIASEKIMFEFGALQSSLFHNFDLFFRNFFAGSSGTQGHEIVQIPKLGQNFLELEVNLVICMK